MIGGALFSDRTALFSNWYTRDNVWILNPSEMYPGRHGKPLAGQYHFSAHPYVADTWHFQDASQGQYKSFGEKLLWIYAGVQPLPCSHFYSFRPRGLGCWLKKTNQKSWLWHFRVLYTLFAGLTGKWCWLVVQCLSPYLWGLWCVVVWKN